MFASVPAVAARALAAFIVSRNGFCLLPSLARRELSGDRRADMVLAKCVLDSAVHEPGQSLYNGVAKA